MPIEQDPDVIARVIERMFWAFRQRHYAGYRVANHKYRRHSSRGMIGDRSLPHMHDVRLRNGVTALAMLARRTGRQDGSPKCYGRAMWIPVLWSNRS